MKTRDEYQKFDELTKDLLKVSHAEVKAKLDAEKQKKKAKKVKRNDSQIHHQH